MRTLTDHPDIESRSIRRRRGCLRNDAVVTRAATPLGESRGEMMRASGQRTGPWQETERRIACTQS